MPVEHLLRDPVLILLAIASLVSWAIIVDCVLVLRRSAREDEAVILGEHAPGAPLAILKEELRLHADDGRDQRLLVLDTAISLLRHRLERTLPLLGIIGSTAPYVGLFGTVIGIIQAFQAIQARNNMSPSVVAGGIATALVATAMGLAVAIPAVAAHHLISSAISRRTAFWESVVAKWLPEESSRGEEHEPVSVA